MHKLAIMALKQNKYKFEIQLLQENFHVKSTHYFTVQVTLTCFIQN